MDKKHFDLHIYFYNGKDIVRRMLSLEELITTIDVLVHTYYHSDTNFIKSIIID